MKHKISNRQGFTLVELLVSIVIISLFFAMLSSIMISFQKSYYRSQMLRQQREDVDIFCHAFQQMVDNANLNGLPVTFYLQTNKMEWQVANHSWLIYHYSFKQLTLVMTNQMIVLKTITAIEIINNTQHEIIIQFYTADQKQYQRTYCILHLKSEVVS